MILFLKILGEAEFKSKGKPNQINLLFLNCVTINFYYVFIQFNLLCDFEMMLEIEIVSEGRS